MAVPAEASFGKILVNYVPATSVLGLLDQAAALLRTAGLGLVTVASTSAVPVALGVFWFLRATARGESRWQVQVMHAAVLAGFLWFRHLGQGACAWALTQVVRGSPIGTVHCFRLALSEAGSLLFVGATRLALVGLLAACGVVPGVWLTSRWLPVLPVLVEERLRYMAVLRRAGELTAKSPGRYFAAAIFPGGILLGGTVGVGIFLNVALWLSQKLLGFDAGYAQAILLPNHLLTVLAFALIAWVLLEPFRACLQYVVYLDAIARAEGADLAGKLAAAFEQSNAA